MTKERFTERQLKEVRRRHTNGVSQAELASVCKCSIGLINDVVSNHPDSIYYDEEYEKREQQSLAACVEEMVDNI